MSKQPDRADPPLISVLAFCLSVLALIGFVLCLMGEVFLVATTDAAALSSPHEFAFPWVPLIAAIGLAALSGLLRR